MRARTGPLASIDVERFAAFTDVRTGGNPAGVVLDASALAEDPARMLAIAATVGFSETVFVTDGPVTPGRRHYSVRYFAPQAEVPFCGHATIALGVAIGRRVGAGTFDLSGMSGDIPIEVVSAAGGRWRTTFTSAEPWHEPLPDDQLGELLDCFRWGRTVLDQSVPPAVAYAGARHVIVPLRDRGILSTAAYDFHQLRQLSIRHGWVTIHLACSKSPTLHHVRAPFPYGGVVEDPATGAGAAAYAAYLRDTGRLTAPTTMTIRQGVEMGSPSTISVHVGLHGPVQVQRSRCV